MLLNVLCMLYFLSHVLADLVGFALTRIRLRSSTNPGSGKVTFLSSANATVQLNCANSTFTQKVTNCLLHVLNLRPVCAYTDTG
jgi:hypothetical protein